MSSLCSCTLILDDPGRPLLYFVKFVIESVICELLCSVIALLPPSFVLSERCTEKPVSSMAESGTIADIQVSVRQIMQQSLVSRWYEMCARSSQSLLSSD